MKVEDRHNSFYNIELSKSGKKKHSTSRTAVQGAEKFMLGDGKEGQDDSFLKKLLDEFEHESKDLEKSPSEETVLKYKKKLEEIIVYVVKNAYRLVIRKRSALLKEGSEYAVVKMMRKELDDIMIDILHNERKKLLVIERMGKIRGLLIDLLK